MRASTLQGGRRPAPLQVREEQVLCAGMNILAKGLIPVRDDLPDCRFHRALDRCEGRAVMDREMRKDRAKCRQSCNCSDRRISIFGAHTGLSFRLIGALR